jgi:type II secretory pathway pseudopilin PulG
VEALVAVVLVSIGVVGVFGGLHAIEGAQRRMQTAELLQSLAMDEMDQISSITDPTSTDTSGDFTNEGHPDITWTAEVEQENAQNVDKVTVTAKQGSYSQSLVCLLYVAPTTNTVGGGATGNTGGTGGAGGAGGAGGRSASHVVPAYRATIRRGTAGAGPW